MLFFILSLLLASTTLLAKPVEEGDEPAETFRVIGGQQVPDDTNFPWIVLLKGERRVSYCAFYLFGCWSWAERTVETSYCGGTLIDHYHIVTAAHCFDNGKQSYHWHARLGTVKRDAGVGDHVADFFCGIVQARSCQDHQFHLSRIVRHPLYQENDLFTNVAKYDIAVVTTDGYIPFYSEISPISLPSFLNQPTTTTTTTTTTSALANSGPILRSGTSNDDVQSADWPISEQNCLVVGWGCTVAGGGVPSRPSYLELPVLSDKNCTKRWTIVDPKYQVCAGYSWADLGICPGDSGSGLVCEGPAGLRYLAGVASFAHRNNPAAHPGVFTRVSAHYDFINGNI